MTAIPPPAARRAANIQPMFADLAGGGLAIAHNGNLTNAHTLRTELVAAGRDLPVHLRHRNHHPSGGAQRQARASWTS